MPTTPSASRACSSRSGWARRRAATRRMSSSSTRAPFARSRTRGSPRTSGTPRRASESGRTSWSPSAAATPRRSESDLRPLPVRGRRVRAWVDPASGRMDRGRRVRRAAREVRHTRALRGASPVAPRATSPGVGPGLHGLQLGVRVLHRPGRPRTRAEPAARRDRGGGDRARPRRRARDHAPRPERELVGTRPRTGAPHRVRRAPQGLRCR